ncbi:MULTISPECIES: hypothetical protein [unclassified Streptomyces]|uniref:hypothetical protein n=1 Tax=unclassified Streptomyces TaxID=2593676 RepID=UPI0011E782A6|nr:hypothetical protein [Streptomyces sp. sk2.1]TXS78006.1 hypothetical protein EAO76_06050 [Streptomyces sp. sk2.1]
MTQTSSAPATAAGRPGTRALLRTLAITATLPYIALKTAWIAGSRIGIPDGSPLLEHRATMIVANGVTILMDSAVVVIALLLTRPWGRRVPAWLLVLPVWVASGLLLPIMTGYPTQLVVGLFQGGGVGGGGGGDPFLDEWVFGIVYGGFTVQGLALGTLFALYARDRWGHLWRGTLRDLPESPTAPALRVTAVLVSLLAVVPAVMHLVWATGSTAGLNAARIADRDGPFYIMEAFNVLFSLATAAGVLLLAFRRSALPLAVPLVLAWCGSGASGCWGGWLSIASLTGTQEVSEQPTPTMVVIYGVQMLLGAMVVTLGGYFFSERAAATGPGGPAPSALPSGTRA